MAIYLVKTPSGERLIEARTPSAAINYAVNKEGYEAAVLNAPELAAYVRNGMTIESSTAATSVAA